MALHGPVVVVEDDSNDVDVIIAVLKELGVANEIRQFSNAGDAVHYLMTTTDTPLVILCDVRMPGMDGLSMLKQIQKTEYLRRKAIPFVFFTAIATQELVNEAYDIGVQGYYKKATNYTQLKDQVISILAYWTRSLHPNTSGLQQ